MGTPAYMAPEQLIGESISPAADWYNVGVILYEVLTRQLPFTGNLRDVLTRKMIGAPPRPCEIVPNTPQELDTLVMGMPPSLCLIAPLCPCAFAFNSGVRSERSPLSIIEPRRPSSAMPRRSEVEPLGSGLGSTVAG